MGFYNFDMADTEYFKIDWKVWSICGKKLVKLSDGFRYFNLKIHSTISFFLLSQYQRLPVKLAMYMYIELDHRIEQMSKTMQNFYVKYTSAVFVIPALMTGLINYFILDLGEESFQNDSPMEYVCLF